MKSLSNKSFQSKNISPRDDETQKSNGLDYTWDKFDKEEVKINLQCCKKCNCVICDCNNVCGWDTDPPELIKNSQVSTHKTLASKFSKDLKPMIPNKIKKKSNVTRKCFFKTSQGKNPNHRPVTKSTKYYHMLLQYYQNGPNREQKFEKSRNPVKESFSQVKTLNQDLDINLPNDQRPQRRRITPSRTQKKDASTVTKNVPNEFSPQIHARYTRTEYKNKRNYIKTLKDENSMHEKALHKDSIQSSQETAIQKPISKLRIENPQPQSKIDEKFSTLIDIIKSNEQKYFTSFTRKPKILRPRSRQINPSTKIKNSLNITAQNNFNRRPTNLSSNTKVKFLTVHSSMERRTQTQWKGRNLAKSRPSNTNIIPSCHSCYKNPIRCNCSIGKLQTRK
ncbi:unnamed protein product [Moneuplotes crassus]|uniref:Uncharacterized protein n=1 Tax=Euplotes crassus TaxID=5936 RepID=A0AAD2DA18_EUPCR|nr:unnamed protein product [Moneuplotes crassus]